MKSFRYTTLMILLALTIGRAWAYDFEKDGVYYNIIGGNSVEVTYKTLFSASYVQNVVIPSSVNTLGNRYSVTRVGDYAFAKCTSLGSISLPSTIVSIGKCAFYGCEHLRTIVIKADNPPVLDGSNVFDEVPEDAKIIVPCGSVERYRAMLRARNNRNEECMAVTRLVGVGNGGNELELSDETVAEILSKPLANETNNRFGSPNYPVAYHPKYKPEYGPIKINVIDPSKVIETDYELWFDEMTPVYTHHVTNYVDLRGDSAVRMASHWYLKDLATGEVFQSDTTIVGDNEKIFVDRGISISVNQPYDIGRVWVGKYYHVNNNSEDPSIDNPNNWHNYYNVIAPNNGVISSSIEFEDPDNAWLDGIRDVDAPSLYLNWIRSGTYAAPDPFQGYSSDDANNDYDCSNGSSNTNLHNHNPWDPDEDFENIANRTWAPALLASFWKQGDIINPGPLYSSNSRYADAFKMTPSIDIVFTSDKTKWTRCPVIEMSMDKNVSEGNAERFRLRKHASVDKNGHSLEGDYTQMEASTNPDDPNYIAAQGMGWFPGYAIDVETGMRLNIAFGEDSYLAEFNGNDMLFNPPALKESTVNEVYGDSSQYHDPALFRDGIPVFGGRHFVYIWRPDSIRMISSSPYKEIKNFGYDGGQLLYNTMNFIQNLTNAGVARNLDANLYKLVEWIGMPMGIEGKGWLPEGNDCRIRIRIAKPYAPGYGYDLQANNASLMINDLNPKYRFSTRGYQMPQNVESAWRHFMEDSFCESEYYVQASPNSPSYGYVEYVKTPSCSDNAVVLNAVPANHYCEFVNWTENGAEVSCDAYYSFTVQSDRVLLANFVNHWGLEEETMQHVTVLPNPAKDRVVVNCEEMRNVSLFSSDGRRVKTVNANGANEMEINLSGLAKGLYMLRIETQSGTTVNRKIVVK